MLDSSGCDWIKEYLVIIVVAKQEWLGTTVKKSEKRTTGSFFLLAKFQDY